MNRFRRDETGATAILVALMGTLLFSIGALAIDLGNAFVRQRATQSQADFATLAGVPALPASSTSTGATDPAIVATAAYLYENQPQNDTSALRRTKVQLASDLVDHDRSNGEAYYGDFGNISPLDNTWTGVLAPNPSVNELTVVTPPAMVKFGFAKVMGFSGTKVKSAATGALGSPGATSVAPMFAVSGCDYGPQALTEPANGQQVSPTPLLDLSPGSASGNQATTTAIVNPTVVAPNNLPRVEIDDTSTAMVKISGSHLTSTTWVGFFRDKNIYPDAPTHVAVTLASMPSSTSNNGNGQLQFPISSIPASVRSTAGAWYIRLSSSAPVAPATEPAQWSTAASALPFQVGDFTFRCVGASNAGNFGSLKIPRTDVNPSAWLSTNLSIGLQRPLTLAKRPGSTMASGPFLCTPGAGLPTIYSTSSSLLAKTNCLDTDTGLTTNATTAGLLSTSPTGRLTKNSGKTTAAPYNAGHTCDPDGTSTSKTLTPNSRTYGPFNNDVLTCFMTDPAMQLATIASSSYAGPPVLSEAIYSSPRFFWVPVFGVAPGNGGSQHYTIIDMRPAFLTDQPVGATRANNSVCAVASGSCTTYNGLGFTNAGVNRLTVFFFNLKALPSIAGQAPTADYFGVGPKVATLTH